MPNINETDNLATGDDTTTGLIREITEARNQSIKNGNTLVGLTAELRDISRRVDAQHRGMKLQSVVSYVVIVIVIWGAYRLLHQGRIDQLELDKAVLRRQHAAVRAELDRLRDGLEKRQDAETKALAFYQHLAKGHIKRAIAEYPEISRLPLSRVEAAVFSDKIQRKRNELGYARFTEGMHAVGVKDYQQAVASFKKSLKFLPKPPHAASLHYYMGISLMKLGAYIEATAELENAIDKGAERTVSRDVRYFLASSYDMLSRRDKAKQIYAAYAKRNPSTGYARIARRRIRALSQ